MRTSTQRMVVSAHASSHQDGGSDELDVATLGGFPGGATTFLRDDGTFAAAGGGGYTDEQAQDAIGGMVDTTLVYTDGTPLLSRAALTGAVTASGGSNATALGSFTKSQLDTAVSDGNPLYVGDITQYTDEIAQDAVGGILVDTATVDLVYADATPSITANVIPAGLEPLLTIANLTGLVPVAKAGFQAGGAGAASWPKLAAGTVLTTPEAGAFEFDGTAHFETIDATTGRGQVCSQHIFRLAANGSAIGSAIADYFGANSAFSTVTNGVYEIWLHLWFLKSTAGTVTSTITNTQTYTNIVAMRFVTNAAGIANGNAGAAGIVTTTSAAAALPATSSLTDAANHLMLIRALAECGTAGNIRIQATESAGTITPLRGSYYTARRLYAGNVGTFVA